MNELVIHSYEKANIIIFKDEHEVLIEILKCFVVVNDDRPGSKYDNGENMYLAREMIIEKAAKILEARKKTEEEREKLGSTLVVLAEKLAKEAFGE